VKLKNLKKNQMVKVVLKIKMGNIDPQQMEMEINRRVKLKKEFKVSLHRQLKKKNKHQMILKSWLKK
jgi:hypothetical protein